MSFNRDDIYREEIVREEARLDERERRDRKAKELARQKEKEKAVQKAFMNWSLYALGSYMAYKALLLFFR